MRRLLLPLLMMLPAAAPDAMVDAAGAPVETVLSDDAEARWVPFELTQANQIRFAMTLDGRAVNAILDTGVSVSVLARASIAARGERIRPAGNADAIGGPVALGWMLTREVTLGGLMRTGGGVSVADIPAAATGGDGIDLLVGRDLIGGEAIDIDYPRRRFRLIGSGRLPFAGSVAPLALSPDRRVYESAIRLGRRQLSPMVVDTGDGAAVTVAHAGWDEAGIGVRTTSAMAFGLAGATVSALAIVPELGVGGLVARQAEVRIEPVGGFSQSIGVAGRIGSGFLQHYRVLLDPAAGRMVLSPGPEADRPPPRSTSGLLFDVMADRLRVLHVMRGGPGEAEGWVRGDTICSVDGTAIADDYPHSAIAAWSIGEPGRQVALGTCDGHVRTMTLRRFY